VRLLVSAAMLNIVKFINSLGDRSA